MISLSGNITSFLFASLVLMLVSQGKLAQPLYESTLKDQQGSPTSNASRQFQNASMMHVVANAASENNALIAYRVLQDLILGLPIGRVIVDESIQSDAMAMVQQLQILAPTLPIHAPNRGFSFAQAVHKQIQRADSVRVAHLEATGVNPGQRSAFVDSTKPPPRNNNPRGVTIGPSSVGNDGGERVRKTRPRWIDLVVADAATACGSLGSHESGFGGHVLDGFAQSGEIIIAVRTATATKLTRDTSLARGVPSVATDGPAPLPASLAVRCLIAIRSWLERAGAADALHAGTEHQSGVLQLVGYGAGPPTLRQGTQQGTQSMQGAHTVGDSSRTESGFGIISEAPPPLLVFHARRSKASPAKEQENDRKGGVQGRRRRRSSSASSDEEAGAGGVQWGSHPIDRWFVAIQGTGGARRRGRESPGPVRRVRASATGFYFDECYPGSGEQGPCAAGAADEGLDWAAMQGGLRMISIPNLGKLQEARHQEGHDSSSSSSAGRTPPMPCLHLALAPGWMHRIAAGSTAGCLSLPLRRESHGAGSVYDRASDRLRILWYGGQDGLQAEASEAVRTVPGLALLQSAVGTNNNFSTAAALLARMDSDSDSELALNAQTSGLQHMVWRSHAQTMMSDASVELVARVLGPPGATGVDPVAVMEQLGVAEFIVSQRTFADLLGVPRHESWFANRGTERRGGWRLLVARGPRRSDVDTVGALIEEGTLPHAGDVRWSWTGTGSIEDGSSRLPNPQDGGTDNMLRGSLQHDARLSPAAVRRLHAELEARQRPPPSECRGRRLLLFQWKYEMKTQGLSAMFQYLSAALALARATGRVLVEVPTQSVPGSWSGFKTAAWRRKGDNAGTKAEGGSRGREPHLADEWRRAVPSQCDGDLFACYFAPLSTCTVEPEDIDALVDAAREQGTYQGPPLSLSRDFMDKEHADLVPELPTDLEWIFGSHGSVQGSSTGIPGTVPSDDTGPSSSAHVHVSVEEAMQARAMEYIERSRLDDRRVLRISYIEMHGTMMRHVTREHTGAPDWWSAAVGQDGLGRGLWFAAMQAYLWVPKEASFSGRGYRRLIQGVRGTGARYILQAECLRLWEDADRSSPPNRFSAEVHPMGLGLGPGLGPGVGPGVGPRDGIDEPSEAKSAMNLRAMCERMGFLFPGNSGGTNLLPPVFGLHLRRGDTTDMFYRGQGGLHAVLGPAKALLRGAGVASAPAVFASDWGVARSKAGLLGAPELVVKVPDAAVVSMGPAGFAQTVETLIGEGNSRLAGAEMRLNAGVIADIHALSFSTHFVGTCMSQLSRLAADLALAFGRLSARPVAIDLRECAMVEHTLTVEEGWRYPFASHSS